MDLGAGLHESLSAVVADDTEAIRRLVRFVLEQDGIKVLAEAGDGRTAVELVAEHRPTAIILDLAMPVMDGMQAIPEIRAASPETKIIVLSGFDGRVLREARARGAHVCLEKGTHLARLGSFIRAELDQESARA